VKFRIIRLCAAFEIMSALTSPADIFAAEVSTTPKPTALAIFVLIWPFFSRSAASGTSISSVQRCAAVSPSMSCAVMRSRDPSGEGLQITRCAAVRSASRSSYRTGDL